MEHGLIKKLKVPQLAKKSQTSYWPRRFIVTFVRARHLSLSCARSIQFMRPIPLYEDPFLYLYSRLLLRIPSGLFPSGSPTKPLYAPLLSPCRFKSCRFHNCAVDVSVLLEYDVTPLGCQLPGLLKIMWLVVVPVCPLPREKPLVTQIEGNLIFQFNS